MMKYALFVGEMLIDFIPRPSDEDGELCYQPHPGGAVANAAVALARLGGAARFVGKLGEDSFGYLLLETLRENRVDTRFVSTTAQANTTLALVTLQANGQRAFSFYRQHTADTLLEISDLDTRAWENVALLHAGSVSLSVDPARSATLSALKLAHARGLPVSFDVNARPALWSSEAGLREMLGRVITHVDLLKCSAEEVHYLDPSLLTSLHPGDRTRLIACGQQLLTQGPVLVLITRGELDTLLMNSRNTIIMPTSTRAALDTTGAGDAFMGALLSRLLKHNWTAVAQLAALSASELQELGEFANKAAGISCTRYGGIASLPYLAELEN
ncbi:MAG: carbohydrate kinase family protein [Ktedonobacteraceae bacterium]